MTAKMFDVVATGGESVIVHGDKACGKTRNADALATHFGMVAILDDWCPRYRRQNYLMRGALILTNEEPRGPFNIPVQVVSFADAMAQIESQIAEGM